MITVRYVACSLYQLLAGLYAPWAYDRQAKHQSRFKTGLLARIPELKL